jgi:hypothetical protein
MLAQGNEAATTSNPNADGVSDNSTPGGSMADFQRLRMVLHELSSASGLVGSTGGMSDLDSSSGDNDSDDDDDYEEHQADDERAKPLPKRTAAIVQRARERVSELEGMLGAASLAQKKFLSTIANLERALSEARATNQAVAGGGAGSGGGSGAPHMATPVLDPHSSSNPNASANVNNILANMTPDGERYAPVACTDAFEANLAIFCQSEGGVGDADDATDGCAIEEEEEWGFADFPLAAAGSVASAGVTSNKLTVPVPVVDRMLKPAMATLGGASLHTRMPVQLFPCPRLGVSLDFSFQQMHQLIYLHSVATMQAQLP